MDKGIPEGTLILTRSEVSSLADLRAYIDIVEEAFKIHAAGKSFGTGMLHADAAENVEFHIKAGGVSLSRNYFALKVNGSSFGNMEKFGLPNIMGVIVLFDGDSIFPLAIMDSMEITRMRTGAATAVAAKYLARKDSKTATICGYGNQGRIQLRAIKEVLPIETAYVWGRNEKRGSEFAAEMTDRLKIDVHYEGDLSRAAGVSDVIVTCTPAKEPFLKADFIRPGAFIAAVGGDSPDKRELEAELFRKSRVYCDITSQCATVGELHHAVEAGVTKVDDVAGELGEVAAGRIDGRTDSDEIIIYDSTGTAIQDAAAAALCYEAAVKAGAGKIVNLMK